MKVDLTTAIISAIVGVILAYVLAGNIMPELKPVVVKNLNHTTSSTLDDPNPEIFNYRALNPTVEVFVDCTNYDANGSCINGGN